MLTPGTHELLPGESVPLTCRVSGIESALVDWTTSAGTVDGMGVFTAPAILPPVNPVAVRCAWQGDPQLFALHDMIAVHAGSKGLFLHSFTHRLVLDTFDLLIGVDQSGGIDQARNGLARCQGMLQFPGPGPTCGLIVVHADGIQHFLIQSKIRQQLLCLQGMHLWICIGQLHINIMQ